MIRHDVDDDADADGVRLRDQRVRVRERAEGRLNVPVIGDVIAGVGHGRRIPRVEPDRVNAETGQIGQVRAHSGQIADPVPVRIGEAAHVQLINSGSAPPLITGRRPARAKSADTVRAEVYHVYLLPIVFRQGFARRVARNAGCIGCVWELTAARDQPLMPPAVRPAMMLRWKIRKNTMLGMAAIADAAMIRSCGVAPWAACQIPTL